MRAGAIKFLIIPLGLVTAVPGCGLYSKDDWPSLAGPQVIAGDSQPAPPPGSPPPALNADGPQLDGPRLDDPGLDGPRRAALVARLVQHGGDFDRLAGAVDGLVAAYRADAGSLSRDSRLADWNKAQIGLSRLQGRLFEVKRLRAIIAEDVALGVHLLAGRRLEGAVLDGGRLYGRVDAYYRDRRALALAQSSRLAALRGNRPTAAAEHRQALVVIRFRRPDVAFEDGLATAVEAARRRFPDVAFEVVAAASTPGQGIDSALQRVLRALMGLKVVPVRISNLTDAGIAAPEVRIYVK